MITRMPIYNRPIVDGFEKQNRNNKLVNCVAGLITGLTLLYGIWWLYGVWVYD